jgi:hypothetical protein
MTMAAKGFHWSLGLFRCGTFWNNKFRVLPEIETGELHGTRVCGALCGEVFWSFLWFRGWLVW